ncbi:hypothetical protein LPB136_10755 [Tenacibaculum todarodis]|uniref:Uncharacterized protein n=1 Tax=Tenacibaculum todarodis TaxID=1850252 RepID=A0A1L3JL39_9FLAO|nr:hypothetical protein [Tenacibaculum todarodis]APG65813.1 hypothetical protein LPB136_10755 [Tenacibaculum todarodis]
MKKWIINQSETTNFYLILTEKSVWLTEKPKEVNIDELINDKKLTEVRIERYVDDIKEFIFIDTNSTLEINLKDDDKEDIELPLESSIYNEIKSFLIPNLKDTKVKDYSLIKQIQPAVIGTLIFGAITYFLHTIALSLQNGEEIRTSGRRGLIKKIFVGIADFLGPTGSLIIGGLVTLFFIYILIKTISKPQQGKVIKTKSFTELKF